MVTATGLQPQSTTTFMINTAGTKEHFQENDVENFPTVDDSIKSHFKPNFAVYTIKESERNQQSGNMLIPEQTVLNWQIALLKSLSLPEAAPLSASFPQVASQESQMIVI